MDKGKLGMLGIIGGMVGMIALSSYTVHNDPRISPEEYDEISRTSVSVGVAGSLIGTISTKVVKYAKRHEEAFDNHPLRGTESWERCLLEFPDPLGHYERRQSFYGCLVHFEETQ